MSVAIIVAGGLGTRARGMTGDRLPKALLDVAGVPIIVRQLRYLAREGILRVGVLAGHLGEVVEAVARQEADRLGLNLTVCIEPHPLGTAGNLPAMAGLIGQSDFLVVYGDVVFDMSLSRLLAFHERSGTVATIVAHPNDHPETSDLLVSNAEGQVSAILSKTERTAGDYRNLVPAAVYVCKPEVLDFIPNGERSDFIHDLFPSLLNAGKRIAAYTTPEYFRDMGTTERHTMAAADVRSGMVSAMNASIERPALFFDCDGVLNEEPGGHGVLSPDDVRLVDGAAAAVRRSRAAGFITVAVTNKPQVAKGMVSEATLQAILGRLETLLAREGAFVDRVYACPHHPDRGFPGEVIELKVNCECRKPAPGMLLQAMRDLPIKRDSSAIIGDSWRDIAAGRRASIYTYAVRTGAGGRELPDGAYPHAWFADIAEAVDFAVHYNRLAGAIAARLRSSIGSRRFMVGVCGQARGGKSTLAHALERTLADQGVSSAHVRLDDWILPASERTADMNALGRNQVHLYQDVAQCLADGGQVTAPGYDIATREAGHARMYSAGGAEVIIMDGIFAGHATIRDQLDVIVYVDMPTHTQLARLHDFYAWKGLTAEDTIALIASRRRDEWPLVAEQRQSANIIVASLEGGP